MNTIQSVIETVRQAFPEYESEGQVAYLLQHYDAPTAVEVILQDQLAQAAERVASVLRA